MDLCDSCSQVLQTVVELMVSEGEAVIFQGIDKVYLQISTEDGEIRRALVPVTTMQKENVPSAHSLPEAVKVCGTFDDASLAGTGSAALGVKMITGYGLTETCAAYSITPLEGDPHVGAQGKASQAPDVETKVSPAGELLIKGPCVMKGYYKQPEKTAQVIDVDGWYHTGDVGRIDEEGFVWITGRASRTIILSSGKKIAPEELEEKLLSLPGIREALVTGEGESRDVRAEVYSALPEERTRQIIGELNLTLPVYKRIKTVVVRKEPFPRTSSGKIKV